MIPLTGYLWAAGFDNEVGLGAIETAVPFFKGQPLIVHSLGTFSGGEVVYLADGTIAVLGNPSFDLVADVIGDNQLNYIQATYTPGGVGLSAKMTVRTLFGNTGASDYKAAFANFNAVLQLPQKSDLGPNRIWRAYRDVPLHFVVKAAL